jgi:potassium channel subfamily K, other eukaryote
MGRWLSMVANFIIEGRSESHRRKIQRRELTQRDLDIMDANGDGTVTRAEFLEFMLVAMNKIDQDLVDELRDHFNRLDLNETGELSHADLVDGERRKLKTAKRKLTLSAYKKRLLDQASSGKRH